MTHDHINSPSHYIGSNGVQGIDVVDGLGWGPAFCLGNAVKYLLRAGRKSPDALTDLRKARRNCEMALEMVPPRATNDSLGRRTVIRQAVEGFALSEMRANLLEEISMLPSIGGVEWQRRLGFIVKMLSEEIRAEEAKGSYVVGILSPEKLAQLHAELKACSGPSVFNGQAGTFQVIDQRHEGQYLIVSPDVAQRIADGEHPMVAGRNEAQP